MTAGSQILTSPVKTAINKQTDRIMTNSAETSNGISQRMRAERSVLRGLAQNPLDAWPQCCMLRKSDFHEYGSLFVMLRVLITSYIGDNRHPVVNEDVLTAAASEFSIDTSDIGPLFEFAHHSAFTEGLATVLGRSVTLDELTRQGRVASHCQRIAEQQLGLIVETPDTRTFAGIDASELYAYATQEADWLVDGVFTIDEPLLVGARSKGCKTLQLTDLAVAIASQTKWMGIFDVPKRRKVLFITGEANYRRISKHIQKACKARGIAFADLKGFLRVEAIEFPSLPSAADQAAIHADVQEHGFEVVIIDPLYRGLAGVDSARLSEMGSAIKGFQAACAPACMILSHHVVKSAAREYGEPPQLEDMTGAGLAESCGQWWLVGRNEKYQWDWKHDLCVQFGGREGQAGGRRILFNEAGWTFQVDAWHEYTEQSQAELQKQRDDVRRNADERKRSSARIQIMKAIRNVKTPQSKNQIEINSGAVQADFRVVFAEMVREQTLVQRSYRDSRNRMQSSGFLLCEYAKEYDSQEMFVDVR